MGVECLVIRLGTESRCVVKHLDFVGIKYPLAKTLQELTDCRSVKSLKGCRL